MPEGASLPRVPAIVVKDRGVEQRAPDEFAYPADRFELLRADNAGGAHQVDPRTVKPAVANTDPDHAGGLIDFVEGGLTESDVDYNRHAGGELAELAPSVHGYAQDALYVADASHSRGIGGAHD